MLPESSGSYKIDNSDPDPSWLPSRINHEVKILTEIMMRSLLGQGLCNNMEIRKRNSAGDRARERVMRSASYVVNMKANRGQILRDKTDGS